MDLTLQFENLNLANQFAMEGKNMAFAVELIYDGKPLPKDLFLDIMIEKTQMLVTHLKTLSTWVGVSIKY